MVPIFQSNKLLPYNTPRPNSTNIDNFIGIFVSEANHMHEELASLTPILLVLLYFLLALIKKLINE